MNSRWAALIAASLVAFGAIEIAWQIRHQYDEQDPFPSLGMTARKGQQLAGISDISKREAQLLSELDRHIDLVLPKDTRIFMTGMIGPTNYNKLGIYYWAAYYLFPREIATSLDHTSRVTNDSFLGRTSDSDQEILANGFDVRIDYADGVHTSKGLHKLAIKDPVNPDWFDSKSDLVIAFLLPLLTALAGMWLFRFLFPSLGLRMPLLEQMASGLGLGMMAVAALTLGVKLCGFHGQGLVLVLTASGAIAELWRDRKILFTHITNGCRKLVRNPIAAIFVVIGLLVFLILFRIAGLQGLVDGDAMRWMLKAKIIHLYTGGEIVQWFSNPGFAHAHLDYPTLVPSLHSATYDSIGHVDEFVTKFWPAWMLLLLMATLASLNHAGNQWRQATTLALLGWLLLPAIQIYVQWEGSTMPLIFFTVMGFIQCVFWMVGKDRARLGLGLTFLFGGAMTHVEGFIFLALVGGWILLLPSARPPLKLSPSFWKLLAFWFLAALPFVCLRLRIPSLNFENGWAGFALHSPGITLLYWPVIFLMLLARLSFSAGFANWNGEGGQVHWIGKWDGLSSFLNLSTPGLTWLCLLLTVGLWFAVPARRRVLVWLLMMFIGTAAALSGVFTSFISVDGLNDVVNLTQDPAGGRYVLPVFLAWFAALMTLLFIEKPSPPSVPRTSQAVNRTKKTIARAKR